jgi:hypothetical protein
VKTAEELIEMLMAALRFDDLASNGTLRATMTTRTGEFLPCLAAYAASHRR